MELCAAAYKCIDIVQDRRLTANFVTSILYLFEAFIKEWHERSFAIGRQLSHRATRVLFFIQVGVLYAVPEIPEDSHL